MEDNLEQAIHKKLKDPLARLKADVLMFCFVYADLVILAKPNDLGKSALDMYQHYLKFQPYLRMVEEDPNTVINLIRYFLLRNVCMALKFL